MSGSLAEATMLIRTIQDKILSLETENAQLRQQVDQLCEENSRLTRALEDFENKKRQQHLQEDRDQLQEMIKAALAPYEGQIVDLARMVAIRNTLAGILEMVKDHHGIPKAPHVVVRREPHDPGRLVLDFEVELLEQQEQEFWIPRLQ